MSPEKRQEIIDDLRLNNSIIMVYLKTGLPLIGNVLKLLAKSILISLGLTAAASATNAVIHKNMFESAACP